MKNEEKKKSFIKIGWIKPEIIRCFAKFSLYTAAASSCSYLIDRPIAETTRPFIMRYYSFVLFLIFLIYFSTFLFFSTSSMYNSPPPLYLYSFTLSIGVKTGGRWGNSTKICEILQKTLRDIKYFPPCLRPKRFRNHVWSPPYFSSFFKHNYLVIHLFWFKIVLIGTIGKAVPISVSLEQSHQMTIRTILNEHK